MEDELDVVIGILTETQQKYRDGQISNLGYARGISNAIQKLTLALVNCAKE